MGNTFFKKLKWGIPTDPHFSGISSPFLVNFVPNIDLLVLIFEMARGLNIRGIFKNFKECQVSWKNRQKRPNGWWRRVFGFFPKNLETAIIGAKKPGREPP
jgi:hypothetical protein